MANVANLDIVLDLDSGQFTGTLNRAGQALQVFGRNINAQNASIGRIEKSVTGLTSKLRDHMVILGQVRGAMHTVWGVTGAPMMGIIKANAELERMQALMQGVAKGTAAQRAAQAKGDFNFAIDLAKNAPFQMNELAMSMVKLRSAGIDPTTGSMKALTDAVAAFGGDDQTLHRATIAIQQMAGKGVISMEELRQQLGEAVPTAMSLLARGAGLSMAELTKKIASGTVEAQTALTILFNEFKQEYDGAGRQMMTTWNGLISQLKTEWALFAKELGDAGFFDDAKRALRSVMEVLRQPEVIASMKMVVSQLGELLRVAMQFGGFLAAHSSTILQWGAALALVSGAKGLLGVLASLKVVQMGMASFAASVAMTSVSTTGLWASFARMTVMQQAGAMAAGLRGALNGLLMTLTGFGGPVGVAIAAIGGLIAWLVKLRFEAKQTAQSIERVMKMRIGDVMSDEDYKGSANKLRKLEEQMRAINEFRKAVAAGKTLAARGWAESIVSLTGDDFLARQLLGGGTKGLSVAVDKLAKGIYSQIKDLTTRVNASLTTAGQMAANSYAQSALEGIDAGFNKIRERQAQEKVDLERTFLNSGTKPDEAQKARIKLREDHLQEMINLDWKELNQVTAQTLSLKGAERERAEALERLIKERIEMRSDELAAMKSAPSQLTELTLPKKPGEGKQLTPGESAMQSMMVRIANLKAQIADGDAELAKLEEKFGFSLRGESPAMKALLRQKAAELDKLLEDWEKLKQVNQQADEAREKMQDIQSRLTERAGEASAQLMSKNFYETQTSGMRQLNAQIAEQKTRILATKDGAEEWRTKWEEVAQTMRASQSAIDAATFAADMQASTIRDNLDTIINPLERAKAELLAFNEEIDRALARSTVNATPEVRAQAEAAASEAKIAHQRKVEFENRSSLKRMLDGWSDISTRISDFWGESMDRMGSELANFVTTGKANFKDLTRSILADLAKIALQKAIAGIATSIFGGMFGGGGWGGSIAGAMSNSASSISGGLGSGIIQAYGSGAKLFANGGVMTSNGSLPLNMYSKGGIANRPQMAIFGEGRVPEAYVPLPDGRRIPVAMQGATGQASVQVSVHVDNSGNSNSDVSADGQNARQLGEMMSATVRDAMSKEMRPGGLLWKMKQGQI